MCRRRWGLCVLLLGATEAMAQGRVKSSGDQERDPHAGHSMSMPVPGPANQPPPRSAHPSSQPQEAAAKPGAPTSARNDPHAAHGARSAFMLPAEPAASSPMAGHGAHQGKTAAEHFDQMTSPHGCPPGSYYHLAMSMCLSRPMAHGVGSVMPMVNGFFVDTWD